MINRVYFTFTLPIAAGFPVQQRAEHPGGKIQPETDL